MSTFLRLEVDDQMFIESNAKSSASYLDLSKGKDDAFKSPLDHSEGISNMQSVTPQVSEESHCISSNHQALPEDNAQQSISTANDQHNEAIDDVNNEAKRPEVIMQIIFHRLRSKYMRHQMVGISRLVLQTTFYRQ